MKIKIQFAITLIVLLFCTFKTYSQGGDNAAAAFGAPITLPFGAAGTTCGAVNNYSPLSLFVGPGPGFLPVSDNADWLYYFVAPFNGVVDVDLSNYFGPGTAIMAYNTVPNALGTNWISTSFTGATPIYSRLSVTVTTGVGYYIMIDHNSNVGFPLTCFNYSLNIKYHVNPPAAPLQPACTNIGYDAGNMGGWIGTYGATTQNTVGATTPIYTPMYYTTVASQHSITSGAGTDIYGGFPIVNPLGGTNSLRLGDVGVFGDIGQYLGGIPGNGGATIEQKFTVTPANALFVYYYAVVLQDAGVDHTNPEQPFFKTDVFDCTGAAIACGNYLVTGGPGIPGFTLSGSGSNVYWKNWSPVAVDLTPYIGTCVTVRYTVGDCTRGAHFAYAYIDAICSPLAITGINVICPTKSTTLTAPPGLFSYSWTPGGASTQSVVVSPTVTTTYTCELTSYSSCKTFLTYSVSLFPQVVASALSLTVCSGTPANITTTVSPAGGTYSWSPGGTILPSLSVSPLTTTSYTCTYTDLNGCKDTALSRVTVNPLPIMVVPPNVSVCKNNIVAATTFTSNLAGTTFSWTNSNPAIGLGANGTVNTPSFTALNAGGAPITAVISVTPTSVNGCVGVPVSFSITVNPPPLAPTVANATICPSATVTLSAIAPGGTYKWYDALVAGTLLITNPTYTTPSLTLTTLYYVNTTDAAGCISPFTTVTVTISNALTVSAGSNQTICVGANATLSVSPSGVGYVYTWDSPGSLGFSAIANPLVSPTITTNYSVTVTNPGGCVGTDQILVQVNPLPIANVGLPIAFCSGQSGIIGAASVVGYSYAWSPGTGLSSAIISNPTVILTNATALPVISIYSLTATFNGCQGTNTVQVTVNPIPVSVAGAPITICNGQTGSIGGPSVAGYNYSWAPPTNLSSSTISNPIVTGVNPGVSSINVLYSLTTVVALTSCQSTSSVMVTVLPVATVAANAVPSSCEGAVNIPISGTVGGSASTGIWSGGLGSITSGIPTTNGSYTPSAAEFAFGSVTLTLTAIATAPCPNVSTTLLITFYKNPVVNYTVDIPKGCPEHCVVFTDKSTISAPDFIQAWAWDFGDGSNSTIQNPAHCYPNSGFYTVSLEVTSNHLCTSTLTIANMIEVYPMPVASFVPNPLTADIFDPVINFQNTSQGAVSYYWDFGDYAAVGSGNTSTLTNPSHIYTYANVYNVNLVATSAHGCIAYATVNVEVKPAFTFYIPNCFTPGVDDGINDVFTGMGIGIEKYEMWIFDRWGAMIYYTDDIYKGWNGKVQGKSKGAQQDVYVWKVKIKDVFGVKHDYIGHVTLLN